MSGTGLPIEIKNTAWKKAQNVPHLTNKPILRLEFKQQIGFTSLQSYDRSHKNVTSLVMRIKTLTASERKLNTRKGTELLMGTLVIRSGAMLRSFSSLIGMQTSV